MKALLGLGTSAAGVAPEARRTTPRCSPRGGGGMDADLQDLSGNKSLCDYYRVPESGMAEFVKELIAGAQRLKLEERIETLVRQVTGFRMKFEQIVALPARLTANLLNGYVDFLGYDALALEKRPMLALETGPRPVFPPGRCRAVARNWANSRPATIRTTTPTGFAASWTWWSATPGPATARRSISPPIAGWGVAGAVAASDLKR